MTVRSSAVAGAVLVPTVLSEPITAANGTSNIPVWLIVAAGIVAIVGLFTAVGVIRRHRTPPERDAP